MRLCGVMGQILLRGIVWVDEVSVHKTLEKRAEIDENKPQLGGNGSSHQCAISMSSVSVVNFLLFLLVSACSCQERI